MYNVFERIMFDLGFTFGFYLKPILDNTDFLVLIIGFITLYAHEYING